eukprot:3939355-Rhodomonas_salina.1
MLGSVEVDSCQGAGRGITEFSIAQRTTCDQAADAAHLDRSPLKRDCWRHCTCQYRRREANAKFDG